MEKTNSESNSLSYDKRFHKAIALFNSGDWYSAHDVFEELWHEGYGLERNTLQGILQVAVAQLHLAGGNRNGAMILFGEALGRLSRLSTPSLGLDLDRLCESVKQRLNILHQDGDPEQFSVPFLFQQTRN
ncbi:DUF309 domain-containing protein [Prochlorococcus sp. MIT 1307]|uniref:DUF309 domain-containing protein n=1 Tax=Prochlorococcus sp. MIT 1307 TaxID=3096219 RepID=UPI002A75594E|nr:DUF309 domain-containing protein [Prochlorococcus sp. MIT 1307]